MQQLPSGAASSNAGMTVASSAPSALHRLFAFSLKTVSIFALAAMNHATRHDEESKDEADTADQANGGDLA
jgi:hypothetical protein